MHNAGEDVQRQSNLLLAVADALLVLWQQHARSPRLATPLLRTVEVLLLHTPLLEMGTASAGVLGKPMLVLAVHVNRNLFCSYSVYNMLGLL